MWRIRHQTLAFVACTLDCRGIMTNPPSWPLLSVATIAFLHFALSRNHSLPLFELERSHRKSARKSESKNTKSHLFLVRPAHVERLFSKLVFSKAWFAGHACSLGGRGVSVRTLSPPASSEGWLHLRVAKPAALPRTSEGGLRGSRHPGIALSALPRFLFFLFCLFGF